MLSLLSILRRFLIVMRAGWSEPAFRGLSMVLGGWLALGTLVYSLREGWSLIEALYFSVMTVTTIGYGDFTPSSPLTQLYTILYAVFGIGFFVTFNARLVQLALATQSSGGDSPGQGADADEG